MGIIQYDLSGIGLQPREDSEECAGAQTENDVANNLKDSAVVASNWRPGRTGSAFRFDPCSHQNRARHGNVLTTGFPDRGPITRAAERVPSPTDSTPRLAAVLYIESKSCQ